MTQKQIQTTLLDRLESVDLSGTLLFAKAKSSKNFCKDSHFVRILFFLDTSLHFVWLSMTSGGVDSLYMINSFDCHDLPKGKSRNDGKNSVEVVK